MLDEDEDEDDEEEDSDDEQGNRRETLGGAKSAKERRLANQNTDEPRRSRDRQRKA